MRKRARDAEPLDSDGHLLRSSPPLFEQSINGQEDPIPLSTSNEGQGSSTTCAKRGPRAAADAKKRNAFAVDIDDVPLALRYGPRPRYRDEQSEQQEVQMFDEDEKALVAEATITPPGASLSSRQQSVLGACGKGGGAPASLRPPRRVELLQTALPHSSSRGALADGCQHFPRTPTRPMIELGGKQYPVYPSGVARLLFPHQLQGVEFLLRRLLLPLPSSPSPLQAGDDGDRGATEGDGAAGGGPRGVILADFMGLGKTMQIVATLALIFGTKVFSERCLQEYCGVPSLRQQRPLRVVVVTPGPVISHWATEFLRFCVSLERICEEGLECSGNGAACGRAPRREDGVVRAFTAFRIFGESKQPKPHHCNNKERREERQPACEPRQPDAMDDVQPLPVTVTNLLDSAKKGNSEEEDSDDDTLTATTTTAASTAGTPLIAPGTPGEPLVTTESNEFAMDPSSGKTPAGALLAVERTSTTPAKPKRRNRRSTPFIPVFEHLVELPDRDEIVQKFSQGGGVLVISYHQIVRYHPDLLAADILVLDEGHRIRNEGTLIAAYMNQLKARLRVVATGYPLQNNLYELYRLLDFSLSNGISRRTLASAIASNERRSGIPQLGTAAEYKDLFLHPITESFAKEMQGLRAEESCALSLSTSKNMDEREDNRLLFGNDWRKRRALLLYYRIQPVVLRRGLSVLAEIIQLPRCSYVVRLRPTNAQMAAYNCFLSLLTAKTTSCFELPIMGSQLLLLPLAKVRQRAELNTSSLRKLFAENVQLLQCPAASPKMLVLWRLLSTSKRLRRKVLIFSQFMGALDECIDFINSKNQHMMVTSTTDDVERAQSEAAASAIKVARCDGSMPISVRVANCAAFNDLSSDVDVLAFSLRAGCEGINLTSASLVVSLDVSWNPALEHEAFARAYRLGQQRLVDVVMLVVAGSVEEVALRRQMAKQLVADSCVDGEVKVATRPFGSDPSSPLNDIGCAGGPSMGLAPPRASIAELKEELTVENNIGHYPDLSSLELYSPLREALSAEPALVHSVEQCSRDFATSFENGEFDQSMCRFSVAAASSNPVLRAKIRRALEVAEDELQLQIKYGGAYLDTLGTSETLLQPPPRQGSQLTVFASDCSVDEVVVTTAVDANRDDDFDFD